MSSANTCSNDQEFAQETVTSASMHTTKDTSTGDVLASGKGTVPKQKDPPEVSEVGGRIIATGINAGRPSQSQAFNQTSIVPQTVSSTTKSTNDLNNDLFPCYSLSKEQQERAWESVKYRSKRRNWAIDKVRKPDNVPETELPNLSGLPEVGVIKNQHASVMFTGQTILPVSHTCLIEHDPIQNEIPEEPS